MYIFIHSKKTPTRDTLSIKRDVEKSKNLLSYIYIYIFIEVYL